MSDLAALLTAVGAALGAVGVGAAAIWKVVKDWQGRKRRAKDASDEALGNLQNTLKLLAEDNLKEAQSKHQLYALLREAQEKALEQTLAVDAQIYTLKRENAALGRENADLRATAARLQGMVEELTVNVAQLNTSLAQLRAQYQPKESQEN